MATPAPSTSPLGAGPWAGCGTSGTCWPAPRASTRTSGSGRSTRAPSPAACSAAPPPCRSPRPVGHGRGLRLIGPRAEGRGPEGVGRPGGRAMEIQMFEQHCANPALSEQLRHRRFLGSRCGRRCAPRAGGAIRGIGVPRFRVYSCACLKPPNKLSAPHQIKSQDKSISKRISRDQQKSKCYRLAI